MTDLVPRLRSSLALSSLLGALLVLGAVIPATAPAATKPASSASTLRTLVKNVSAVPRGAIASSRRARLVRLARRASTNRTRKPCTAVSSLNSLRRALKSTKLRSSVKGLARRADYRARLAAVQAQSVAASRALLRSKKTKRCGGGATQPTVSTTSTKVLRNDINGMSVRFLLPAVRFLPEQAGGKSWTRLALPDTDSPSAPGTPSIPVASGMLAVPDGATMTVRSAKVASYKVDGVELYPAQPEPVDQSVPGLAPQPNFLGGPFVAPKFVVDKNAYAKKGLVPAAPASGGTLGQSRDLTLANLQIPAAQYDPVKDQLKVITSVDVTVDFKGGARAFSSQIDSPWEQPQRRIVDGLLNRAIVRSPGSIVLQPCGEEMLVITNPATRTAADTFAVARRAAGFLVNVREVGAASGQVGTTATQIQTFVRNRLNSPVCIRPSYITIIGDDVLVPTFTTGPGGIPADLPYSMKNDADELPDVAVAGSWATTSVK